MPIALHQNHDDSRIPVRHTARTAPTKCSSSAALPFTVHHRTGRPVYTYSSQPHLYLFAYFVVIHSYNNTLIPLCQYLLKIFSDHASRGEAAWVRAAPPRAVSSAAKASLLQRAPSCGRRQRRTSCAAELTAHTLSSESRRLSAAAKLRHVGKPKASRREDSGDPVKEKNR